MPLAGLATNDLPPRTWRIWWRELPGYWRIGFWTIAVIVTLQAAICARIAIGLQEHPTITRWQQSGVTVNYPWTYDYEPFPGHHLLLEGLFGRSPRNIAGLYVQGPFTEEDFRFIGANCPNLHSFGCRSSWTEGFFPNDIADVQITHEGLSALTACRKLEELDFEFTEIDDSGVRQLIGLPNLRYLGLQGTRVTNAIINDLYRFPELKTCRAQFTDVTFAEVEANQSKHPERELDIWAFSSQPGKELVGFIRWANGEINYFSLQACELVVEGPDDHPEHRKSFLSEETRFNCSMLRVQPGRLGWGDGEYCYTLRVGEFESEPVRIQITDGIPSTRRIEFRMPVTQVTSLTRMSHEGADAARSVFSRATRR